MSMTRAAALKLINKGLKSIRSEIRRRLGLDLGKDCDGASRVAASQCDEIVAVLAEMVRENGEMALGVDAVVGDLKGASVSALLNLWRAFPDLGGCRWNVAHQAQEVATEGDLDVVLHVLRSGDLQGGEPLVVVVGRYGGVADLELLLQLGQRRECAPFVVEAFKQMAERGVPEAIDLLAQGVKGELGAELQKSMLRTEDSEG